MEDTRVIQLNKHKSNVKFSPLLSGDQVEQKEYTMSFGSNSGAGSTVHTETPPPPKTEAPEAKQVNFEKNQEFVPPESQQFVYNDDIAEAEFNEQPGQPEIDEKEENQKLKVADSNAGFLISLYTSIVEPRIADKIKSDVPKISNVLKTNTQIPTDQVREIERFLNTQNKELEQALALKPEQVALIKDALSRVMALHNLNINNPYINLAFAIGSVAITQFFAIDRLVKQRDAQLLAFIEKYKVTVPEGMESAFKKKKLIIKKQPEQKEAA